MVKNKIIVAVVSALMLLAIAPTALAFNKAGVAAEGFTISTGSNYYKPGETVSLTGNAGVNATVSVSVENVQGIVYNGSATPNAGGTYSLSFALAADAYQGEYEARATDGTNEAEAVFVVSTISLQDLAQGGLALVEDAKARCEDFFDRIEAANSTVSVSATQHYDKGVAKLDEAQTLLSEGKPWEALKAEYSAMAEFKKAMRIDSDDEEEAEGVEDDFVEEAAEINRMVQKLNSTLVDLEASGENVTAIRATLASAKAHIDNATSLFDSGSIDGAKTELESAEDALSQAYAEIREIAPGFGICSSSRQGNGGRHGGRGMGHDRDD